MNHTKEGIVAALQVIKDEYTSQEGNECIQCSFFILGKGCIVTNRLPINWEIVNIEPEKTWRAFE